MDSMYALISVIGGPMLAETVATEAYKPAAAQWFHLACPSPPPPLPASPPVSACGFRVVADCCNSERYLTFYRDGVEILSPHHSRRGFHVVLIDPKVRSEPVLTCLPCHPSPC